MKGRQSRHLKDGDGKMNGEHNRRIKPKGLNVTAEEFIWLPSHKQKRIISKLTDSEREQLKDDLLEISRNVCKETPPKTRN